MDSGDRVEMDSWLRVCLKGQTWVSEQNAEFRPRICVFVCLYSAYWETDMAYIVKYGQKYRFPIDSLVYGCREKGSTYGL